MPRPTPQEVLVAAGREVTITNPAKVLFPDAGYTKLDLVRYYLAVADGALRAAGGRPNVLVRYPNGIAGEFFYQKRAPESRLPWIEVVSLRFPSGRSADEVVPRDAAALLWMANLACLELHPHPVRADDLDHPDELRIDLDPVPGVEWSQIREVASVVQATLHDVGLVGWPKTSGSRGMHIYVRILREWTFTDVRRAALAFAREVERRAPAIATSKWWKEERHGVFLDYNQNAKDRTVSSAYSVRPTADATVSAPLTWDEVPEAELEDFTLRTVPERYARLGDVGAAIDAEAFSLEPLLELVARHETQGEGDAPWPPNYAKQPGEPPRVQPSKRRMPDPDELKPTDPTSPRGRAGSVAPAMPSAPARNPDGTVPPTGRRRSTQPLLVISQAADKADALAGLDRWRARHPEAAQNVRDPEDLLIDAMRGRYKVWWRVRVNLRNVPEALRPAAEPPDPDYDPWTEER